MESGEKPDFAWPGLLIWNTWISEFGADDAVIQWHEVELDDIARSSLDNVGLERVTISDFDLYLKLVLVFYIFPVPSWI
jgi:hypothetical protein